ncbi:hypothetical protein Tco_0282048 [Tanacetum coccineum]
MESCFISHGDLYFYRLPHSELDDIEKLPIKRTGKDGVSDGCNLDDLILVYSISYQEFFLKMNLPDHRCTEAQRSHKSKEQSSKTTTCSTETNLEESRDYKPESKINSKIARIQFVFLLRVPPFMGRLVRIMIIPCKRLGQPV